MNPIFETYFTRFEAFEQQSQKPVDRNLGIIVTIPCYHEPDILQTLNCLLNCTMPSCHIEVIIVVNHSETADNSIKQFNQKTFEQLCEYSSAKSTGTISFLPLAAFNISKKQAGVGYARKLAMDEAVHRFAQIDNPEGVIVSCDADTVVDKNYFIEIETFYRNNPQCSAANIYFEHPLTGDLQQEQYQAIAQYELYLRYYVEQLKRIGFPYAFHTIGSCFSVRAKTYCRQGGMNKRQAGEDFYFLQKLFPAECFGEINTTTVYPSSRQSDRVPFGTGTAIAELKQSRQELMTYSTECFNILQDFFVRAKSLQNASPQEIRDTYESLHTCLKKFLPSSDFEQKIIEIQHNTKTYKQFCKRFFRWFNGLQVYKFLNYSCGNGFQKIPIGTAAKELFDKTDMDIFSLLQFYRLRAKKENKE